MVQPRLGHETPSRIALESFQAIYTGCGRFCRVYGMYPGTCRWIIAVDRTLVDIHGVLGHVLIWNGGDSNQPYPCAWYNYVRDLTNGRL